MSRRSVMITKVWFAAGVVTLSALGVSVPSTVFAQHGPGRHAPGPGPAYDPQSETTFKGTVADIKTGRSVLSRLFQMHTMGLGHKGPQEKQLLLKTGTDTVQVHLGPTTFLRERRVEIGKGDTLEVTGSRVTIGDSQVFLAREIRTADAAWTLRDAAGQPLWSAAQTDERGFWTKKKIVLLTTIAAVKVALLATVLRH
jgi:hypothetical protein